jgi:hypothetical protein
MSVDKLREIGGRLAVQWGFRTKESQRSCPVAQKLFPAQFSGH